MIKKLNAADGRDYLPTLLGVVLAIVLLVGGVYLRQDYLTRYASVAASNEQVVVQKPVVVAAVGDISCPPDLEMAEDRCQMLAVRDAIVRAKPDHVLVLGDLQYNNGEPENFSSLFKPLWEPLKAISYAVPGNHEYRTAQATGYYGYWNGDLPQTKQAGETGKGYYSFDLGNWHIQALNSNCEFIGGCDEASEQMKWLRADLAAHKSECSLAFWHHPYFTSGRYTNDFVSRNRSKDFWQALSANQTEIVLNGHDHIYERFAPQDPNGLATDQGIRQFVAGTGGYGYASYQWREPRLANHEFGARTFGYLRLELKESSYAWQFIDINDTVLDHGVGLCRR